MKKEDKSIIPPKKLNEFQRDFGKAISTPFLWEGNTFRTQPHLYPNSILKETLKFSEDFLAWQRVETYNQQYWYRLLESMQNEFPLLCNDLGYFKFNQIASLYLENYPSQSPNLNDLIQFIPQFIKDHLLKNDVLQAYQIEFLEYDYHWARLFIINQNNLSIKNDFNQITAEEAISKKLYFQNGFKILSLSSNLFEKRDLILEDSETKYDHQLNDKSKNYLALFRIENQVHYEILDPMAYRLLELLYASKSLIEAIEILTLDFNDSQLDFLNQNIQNWFKRWTSLNFFISDHEKE